MDHDFRVLTIENWKAVSRKMAQPSESKNKKMQLDYPRRMDIIHDAPQSC